MAVVAVQDECTPVLVGRVSGPFDSSSVDKTRKVHSGSSKMGFATSHCCMGRSKIGCGYGCCPVAQCRKWDNKSQMMGTVTAVG